MGFITDNFSFDASSNTYTLNNTVTISTQVLDDLGTVTQDIIVDGNSKKIIVQCNDFDGLFTGGGQVTDNQSDVITSQYYIELKNFIIEVTGNVKCALIKATGSVKITNCQIIINGNLTDSAGGLVYVSDNTTSSFKKIKIDKSFVTVNGNIGTNSGPLSGYMANGNYIEISNSYSVVNGNLGENSGAFLGAYNGANRTTTIDGCYCIFNGSMGDYSGILAGSYFGSNGSVTINNFYMVTNIDNIPATNNACWISNHRSNLMPTITLIRVGVFNITSKTMKINGYDNSGTWTDGPITGTFINKSIYSEFKTSLLDGLISTYFDTTKFKLRHNKFSQVDDYELNQIKNITNYNWILSGTTNSNIQLLNIDKNFLLLFALPVGTKTIDLPINSTTHGQSNATVNWCDGTTIETNITNTKSHTYTLDSPKFVLISISGIVKRFGRDWDFQNEEPWSGSDYLYEVVSFGQVGLISLSRAFNVNWNTQGILTKIPAHLPSTITDLSYCFADARLLNDPNICLWNVSNINNMSGTFQVTHNFNQNISGWNVSNVTNMFAMFNGAIAFNQNISSWNVSNVSDMGYMFGSASAFNQDISGWNVSNVTHMNGMFSDASAFKQNISGWNFSHVNNIWGMISSCGYNYEQYSQFIQGLSTNSNLPTNLHLGYTGKIRLNNEATNQAYNNLTKSVGSGGKNLTIYDGGAYTQNEISTYNPNTVIKIDSNRTVTISNIKTIITDSGGLFNSYRSNENYTVTFNISNTKKYKLIGYINYDSSQLNEVPTINAQDYIKIFGPDDIILFNSDETDTSFSSKINIDIEYKATFKIQTVSDYFQSACGFYLELIEGGKTITLLSSFSIDNKDFTGNSFTFTPTLPTIISGNTSGTISYSSSDTLIAIVNASTGLITVNTAGIVFITASVAESPEYTGASQVAMLKITDPTEEVSNDEFESLEEFFLSTDNTIGTNPLTVSEPVSSISLSNTLIDTDSIIADVYVNNSTSNVDIAVSSNVSVVSEPNTILAIASIAVENAPRVTSSVQSLSSTSSINVLSILEIKTTAGKLNFSVNVIDLSKRYYAAHFNSSGQIDRTVQGTLSNGIVNFELSGFSMQVMFSSNEEINGGGAIISSGGDPIIQPLIGKQFALATHIKFVNLLADYSNNVFINGQVDILKPIDFPKSIYWDNGFVLTNTVSHIYSNSYYRKFRIWFNGESIEVNADSLQVTNLTDLTKVKIIKFKPKYGLKSISFNKTYPLFDSTQGIRISLGNYLLTIFTDINTDDRHYIELLNSMPYNLSQTSGALIDYNKIIRISSLSGPELFTYTSNPFSQQIYKLM